jgi:hypothetical protein
VRGCTPEATVIGIIGKERLYGLNVNMSGVFQQRKRAQCRVAQQVGEAIDERFT